MAPPNTDTAANAVAASALSGHEAGKQERRNRIVAAASEIIREAGIDGVTVEAIARRASVSPATVYNLFGNRAAVFDHIFDADMAQYDALVAAQAGAGPVGIFFEAIDIATGLYARQPDYYKALMRLSERDGPLYVSFSRPRHAFWARLVREAHAAGALAPDLDHEAAAGALAAIARGALYFWVEGRASLAQLHHQFSYGFGLVLLSMVTETGRATVRARMHAPFPHG
ncbi:TetR/AcrR family transcriptional regulator [Camelimonas sp. ID_303_24]